MSEKSKEEIAAVALGQSLLDAIETTWWEFSEQGYVNKDLFIQTLRDVINGEYFG